MKNLSIVLNVVLAVAVAILYFLHFSSKPAASVSETGMVNAFGGEVAIAYINSDTLLSKYQFYKEVQSRLEEKGKKLSAEYENRARGLQTEIENFQRNAQNMSIAQGRATEEELMKKQQNLIRYQESLQQEIMAEESKLMNELYDKVAEEVRAYGLKNNLQLILTYSKGNGVIFASDSLNITNDVLVGLNAAKKD